MLDSLANVKARLGITETANDTFLTAQITLVSDTIEAYCRRKFLEADYTQTFYRGDCEPKGWLELFHFPVSAVASVVEDSVTLNVSNYRFNKPTGRLVRPRGAFFLPLETVVTYTAGYADGEVPTPILSVLDSIVGERYSKKITGVGLNFGSDVQRISIPGTISIDFDYSLNNNDRKNAFGTILGNNINILDPYRSERAVVGEGKLIYAEEV